MQDLLDARLHPLATTPHNFLYQTLIGYPERYPCWQAMMMMNMTKTLTEPRTEQKWLFFWFFWWLLDLLRSYSRGISEVSRSRQGPPSNLVRITVHPRCKMRGEKWWQPFCLGVNPIVDTSVSTGNKFLNDQSYYAKFPIFFIPDWYPNCLQTTPASVLSHESSQTVPQTALPLHTSTRPS